MTGLFREFFGGFLVAYKVTSCNGRLEGELFLRHTPNKSKPLFSYHFLFLEKPNQRLVSVFQYQHGIYNKLIFLCLLSGCMELCLLP